MSRAPAPNADNQSLHGETAARRQAITELLFFASVGDLYRCKKIALGWGLNLRDPNTADYDKRTPLHLAAAEGSYSAVSWLLQQGCDVNPVDRFQRTPLEDAVRGDHGEISTLLIQAGGKVVGKGGELIDLADSPLSGNVRIFTDYDPEWEVQFLGAVTKTEPYMIVTEYMPGGSLTDIFRTSKKLTIWRAVQLALDCARGLAYLHSRSPQAVIHRDLKPANMMLGGHKIYNSHHKALCLDTSGASNAHPPMDISVGSASGVNANGDLNPAYKMTGETGSYRYMAPEVFRHEPYNNKVDVYSFAMICYQLFECVPPFWWQDPIEAARGAAMQHKRPTWGAVNRAKVVVPPRIKALVERCWHKDYEVRPEFEDIIEELEEISLSIQPTLDTYGTANVKDSGGSSQKDPKSRECCSVQ
ncbi:protein kinase [Dunaliella salina]|uniref:Protein kinase n=1 Tax=Dunaliella salina TaxID=3046 RepID=A0ABQ7G923_DUNSA|nr:protein kinase [Dunaliella salina]|eukprot:KAF5831112.1 protein kinase [Dunaliella salina]